MKWHPTRPEERLTARRWIGGAWTAPVSFEELRPGDVFQAVSPEGEILDPATQEPTETRVGLVTGDPVKNPPTGENGQWYGIGVPASFFASIDDLKKGLT